MRFFSEEHKKNLSNAKKGKHLHLSDEQRRKLSKRRKLGKSGLKKGSKFVHTRFRGWTKNSRRILTSLCSGEHKEVIWCKKCFFMINIEFRERIASLYAGAKTRSKQLGIPCSITIEDILNAWPDSNQCPITQEQLKIEKVKNRNYASRNSPSIDRIIPELGYTKENIAVISYLANSIKNNCTDPEIFERLASWLRKHAYDKDHCQREILQDQPFKVQVLERINESNDRRKIQ